MAGVHDAPDLPKPPMPEQTPEPSRQPQQAPAKVSIGPPPHRGILGPGSGSGVGFGIMDNGPLDGQVAMLQQHDAAAAKVTTVAIIAKIFIGGAPVWGVLLWWPGWPRRAKAAIPAL
jgi:hypothetical protein